MSSKKVSILMLSASALMALVGCPTNGAPSFNWRPQIWVGDSDTKAIVRKSGGSTVVMKCEDAAFDHMICMHNSEIAKAKQAAFDMINACEKWKPGADIQKEAIDDALTDLNQAN